MKTAIMRLLCLALSLVVTPGTVFGASWYVAADQGLGANNGTSWQEAWNSFDQMNWELISPGDTVWIAKGVYSSELKISRSGSPGKPIRIKVSQEAGKVGMVQVPSVSVAGNWVTLDGALNESFGQSCTNTAAIGMITNNILMRITNGVWCASGVYEGHSFKWLDISTQDLPDYNGIRWNPNPNMPQNLEVAYCYIHDVGQDCINWTSGPQDGYDKILIHHNLIDRAGDDALEVGGGASIFNNRIQASRFARGHPDGVQASGNYHRLYNNIIFDFGSSLILMQGQAPEGGDYGHIQIYGNEFYYKDFPYNSSFNRQTTELEMKWYPANSSFNRGTVNYRDWIIANNTFAFLSSGGFAFEARRPPDIGSISNIVAKEILFVNNLFYSNTNSGFGIPYQWSVSESLSNYWSYAQSDVVVDYNVFSTNGVNCQIGYFGTSFKTGEQIGNITAYKRNSSAVPLLNNPAGFDFRPTIDDTVVRGRGTNLSGLNLPGWDRDLYGVQRGAAPAVGADELVSDPSLVVWLRFEEDFESAGYLLDSSGNGNHGVRLGFPSDGSAIRFPRRVPAGLTSGRVMTGHAGDFRWYGDGYGLYQRSGDYAAITNLSRLGQMEKATIALWARYFPATRIDPSYNFSQDGNATLLSAATSTGILGTWDFGRFNQKVVFNNTRFCIMTNSAFTGGNNGRFVVEFPDNGFGNAGDTQVWHHYAVTWETGVVKAYYDGSPFLTNSLQIKTLVVGANRSNPIPWIGVGCDTHGGTPALDDEVGEDYPNNGWFNGMMDDVRIFDRCLSSVEIQGLISSLPTPISRPAGPGRLKMSKK